MTSKIPRTEHEEFWAGEFGDAYTARINVTPEQRLPFWRDLWRRLEGVESVCELGASRGHNLVAIGQIAPHVKRTGVEINPVAFAELAAQEGIDARHCSLLETEGQFDLVFTAGVLINQDPEALPAIYHHLLDLSNRYVLLIEYFNPRPVEVPYHGYRNRLFKRDFAGELLDLAEGEGRPLRVVDTGFLWRRIEPAWDDNTWFLLERKTA